jgi:hypothetical protein
VVDKEHTPILTGRRSLEEARGWEVEVVPLVAGQQSVREGMTGNPQDIRRIIGRLGRTLLDEHEKLFGSYWRHTFGPSSSLMQRLGKGISVRVSRPPREARVEEFPKSVGRPSRSED